MNENQHIEWKSTWKDEYLKWVCGFANADGGTMYIGLDDEGQLVGLENPKKILEDLPNKIRDILGIMAKVNLHVEDDKQFIEIIIEPYSTPISYRGHYYFRSGSTIQDLKGPALEKLLLRKMGMKWDGIIAPDFSLNDLSPNAYEIFRKKARKSKRIPEEDLNDTDENLLKSLGLLSGSELKRAAIIAFGKEPEQLITGAYVKIGFFRTHTDLLYQDEIHGSLFEQVEKTMDLLLTKYMKAHITYDGLTRVETYNFPEKALREAVLNALIHKD
jgi:ATP-dependent DNA helicase RecG